VSVPPASTLVPDAAPAATAILLRDSRDGPEVLLMQRDSGLAFHGGAWVFPGGRVDPDELAEADPLRAARRAAQRETHEEAGLSLALDGLVPFSHWTTPLGMARRFATWFFLVGVEADLHVRVDGSEIRAYRWLSPRAALSLQAAGELTLPPPTFVTLSVLHRFACVADALAAARVEDPPVFVPRPRPTPAGVISLYHGDVAYERGELEQPGPRHRLWMLNHGWRYERTL
jgi:8-oxo-dGTP pyrophosphatase MutT (NUDIX family)